MTTFPQKTPCMQNRDISLEQHEAKIQLAQMRLDVLLKAGTDHAGIQRLREEVAVLRLEHHPDHWFIDPGSGRDTEDGRLRRRALEACWADCPMKARLLCLDRGMLEGPTLQYGIYGGYTEKQRQVVIAAIKERNEGKGPSLQT